MRRSSRLTHCSFQRSNRVRSPDCELRSHPWFRLPASIVTAIQPLSDELNLYIDTHDMTYITTVTTTSLNRNQYTAFKLRPPYYIDKDITVYKHHLTNLKTTCPDLPLTTNIREIIRSNTLITGMISRTNDYNFSMCS